MSNPNDDPAFAAFLDKQTKPAATADEIARLGEHTKRNPPKKSGEVAMWGGGGIFVVLIVLKVLGRVLRADNHADDNPPPPPPPPGAISPAEREAVIRMLQLQRTPPTDDMP